MKIDIKKEELTLNNQLLIPLSCAPDRPTRLTTPDPKSGAATNYATGA